MGRTPDELFGLEVKEQREGQGWSMTEFAARLQREGLSNFHAATVGRMERGERPVRLSEAVVIARVLDTTLDDLVVEPLKGDEELHHAVEAYDFVSKHAAYYDAVRKDWHSEATEQLRRLRDRLAANDVLEEHVDELRETCDQAAGILQRDLKSEWDARFEAMSWQERREHRLRDADLW